MHAGAEPVGLDEPGRLSTVSSIGSLVEEEEEGRKIWLRVDRRAFELPLPTNTGTASSGSSRGAG